MMASTHRVGGAIAGMTCIYAVEPKSLPEAVILLLASVFGALLPDMDSDKSKISYSLGYLSRIICKLFNKTFSHRGVMHSLLACAIYGLCAYLFLIFFRGLLLPFIDNNDFFQISWCICFGVGVAAGAFSHLVLDSLNPEGVKPFLPLSKKKISIAKIRTDSNCEHLVVYPLLIVIYVFITIFVLFNTESIYHAF